MKKEKSYEDLLEKIADNIKKVRKEKGITQEGMIFHGFSYRHYQRIEGRKQGMNLHTLYRLANAFKTDISTFFK